MINFFCAGLFQRYITESGTALGLWAFRPQPEYATHSHTVGRYYNCTTDDSSELMTCLRGLTVPQLLNSVSLFDIFQDVLPYLWGPTSEPNEPDAIFIDTTPKNIFKKGKPRNHSWMAGVNKDEGLLITGGKIFALIKFLHQPSLFIKFSNQLLLSGSNFLQYSMHIVDRFEFVGESNNMSLAFNMNHPNSYCISTYPNIFCLSEQNIL